MSKEKKVREIRKPKVWEALSLIVVMVVLFIFGTKYSMNYVPLMIVVAGYSIFMAWRCGHSWAEIEQATCKKIGRAVPALAVFLCVGMLVGALIYCGTIPMLIYYGTKIISTRWIYLSAFLLCTAFSLLTGTSNGSVTTAGLAMIGLGAAMPNVNLGMLAGAILCGATVGDKISPLSDTTVFTATITGNSVYDHVKHQSKVVLPAAGITMIIYILIGLFSKDAGGSSESLVALQQSLDAVFKWNILLIVPALIVVWGAVTQKSTIITLVIASFVAILIGTFYQGFKFADGIKALYEGFNPSMAVSAREGLVVADLAKDATTVIKRGGITSMTKSFITVFICFFFAASAELNGTMEVLIAKLDKFIKNTVTLVISTGLTMVAMIAVCGSSAPAASMAATLYKKRYEDAGLHSLNLAREIEDFGTGSSAFIPWTSTGLLYLATLNVVEGVTLTSGTFFRYSYLNWLIWAIALFYAATGICIKKLDKKDIVED